mmetsp:Transcript_20804/g.61981  ORF Transcript_20804/g.61981 Transcript_20804/m.61981 type:complete len:339 (-) Transcript_20804:68-1084(-)
MALAMLRGRARAALWPQLRRGLAGAANDGNEGNTGGRRPGRPARRGASPQVNSARIAPDQVAADVEKHVRELQAASRSAPSQSKTFHTPGHQVPYRFRLPPSPDSEEAQRNREKAAEASPGEPGARRGPERAYTDYTGLRFPTLETAENYDYHKDRGLQRLVERAYPIKVPGYRRLDPYLREYIHFLHSVDPARFTISRIASRYRLREKTVMAVVREWGVTRYLSRSGLTKHRDRQSTKEAEVLKAKERAYAKWVGWDQLGDEDDPESDDETIGDFKGWRSTNDWVRRQNVEVEMMSAFPMMEKRDPMPKRVDVDLVVESRQHHKIINWIDPTDKVNF